MGWSCGLVVTVLRDFPRVLTYLSIWEASCEAMNWRLLRSVRTTWPYWGLLQMPRCCPEYIRGQPPGPTAPCYQGPLCLPSTWNLKVASGDMWSGEPQKPILLATDIWGMSEGGCASRCKRRPAIRSTMCKLLPLDGAIYFLKRLHVHFD